MANDPTLEPQDTPESDESAVEQPPKPDAVVLHIQDCPVCHRPTALAACPTCGYSLS